MRNAVMRRRIGWLQKVPGLSAVDAPELTSEAKQMAHKLVTQICQHKGEVSVVPIKCLALSAEAKQWCPWIARQPDVAAVLKNWHSPFACYMRQAGASRLPIGQCWPGEPMAVTDQQMRLVGS